MYVRLSFFDGQGLKSFAEDRIRRKLSPDREVIKRSDGSLITVFIRQQTPTFMYPPVIGPDGKPLSTIQTITECRNTQKELSSATGVIHALVISTSDPRDPCFVSLVFSDDKGFMDWVELRLTLDPGWWTLVDKERITRPNTVIIHVPLWLSIGNAPK